MPDPDHKFRIVYTIEHHRDGMTGEEIAAKHGIGGVGACDNIAIFSIMGTPGEGGPLSVLPLHMRGEDGESLSSEQQWMLWLMWATNLSKEEDLPPFKREACAAIVDATRKAMGITKAPPPTPPAS